MTQKKITQEELDDIIDAHAFFMSTDGECGTKGDLTDTDISHLNFELFDLEGMTRKNTKVR